MSDEQHGPKIEITGTIEDIAKQFVGTAPVISEEARKRLAETLRQATTVSLSPSVAGQLQAAAKEMAQRSVSARAATDMAGVSGLAKDAAQRVLMQHSMASPSAADIARIKSMQLPLRPPPASAEDIAALGDALIASQVRGDRLAKWVVGLTVAIALLTVVLVALTAALVAKELHLLL